MSNEIIRYLIFTRDKIFIKYDLLKYLINKMSNINFIIKKIVEEIQLFDFDNNIINYINDNITNKINIDIGEILSDKILYNALYSSNKIILIIIFKLILENHKIKIFNEILTTLYCGSNMLLLEMIKNKNSSLINVNLLQLKKIIYYGRYTVFLFLMDIIPWKIYELMSQSNIFDLQVEKIINYKEDLLYQSGDFNDEYIGYEELKHVELIKYITSISKAKNYSHIMWTDEIMIFWITLSINNMKNKEYLRNYFISYENLLNILNLNFDFNNKDSIKLHIKYCGRETTWKLITLKYKNIDSILDVLMN